MSNSPDPDLVKVTEVFLIPSSFLVAALCAADTNPHRAAVSLVGFIVSGMWWVCSHEAFAERKPAGASEGIAAHSRRIRIMHWLPLFFVGSWVVSLVIHVVLWSKPLGHH